ncbi:alpha-1B-glycoprotein-like isoform X2 [Mobula hypostoma]|uniref:alpha-1B-glycoprotein-like isoform X2 n=1 Tax=Mobula hypostoma TaxID=723540 RepID=UPI002FC39C3E
MITAALLLLIAVVKDQSENVQAWPARPRIKSDRTDNVYLSDEPVKLTCWTTAPACSAGTFHLYSNQREIEQAPTERKSATFTIANGGDASGIYSCLYTCTVSGRDITSEESDKIEITVVARPARPRIKSDRTDKVYLSDEPVKLTCATTAPACSAGTFHLYSNQREIKQAPTERKSTTFTIANGGDASGIYSCLYTCTVSGRGITSEESDKIEITVVARPARPEIKSDRSDKVYLSGESVKLTCWITGSTCSDGTFYLYQNLQPVKQAPSQRKSTMFTIAMGGTYSCSYACTVSGRRKLSGESERIEITVVAQPARPRIKSDRVNKVYQSDESVRLTCWITSRAHSVGTFHLYRNRQALQHVPAQRNTATFTIENGGDALSIYSCFYTYILSGRSISSDESDRIQIKVVDLPRPSISVASSHVSQGENVTFKCTFMKNISTGTFYLYKNGVRLNDSVPQSADAQNKSTTFTIRNVDTVDSGNYACVYILLDGGRHVMSAPSDAVLLSVSVNSILPWIPIIPVVTLILMLRVLGVYCWIQGKCRGHGDWSTAPPPKDGPNDNIVLADLKVIPRKKKQRGKKESFETQEDDRTLSANVEL